MTGARTGPPGKRQRRPGCSRAALKTQNQINQHNSTSKASGKSEITAADAPMTEPRRIRLVSWRPIAKGNLRGFAEFFR